MSLPSPPVAKKPQPLTRDTDVTTSSPGSPDEVPLGDFFHSPEPEHPLLDSIRDRVGEAALGKYLLSIAAAVLVFLAAASLIALLWNSIPDVVKVGAVGVTGVTLTTAMTARKAVEQSRFRPFYLLSATAIGLPALFMAPVERAREITETGTLVVMLVLVALLFTQLILVVRAGEVPEDEIPAAEPEPSPGTPANPWALAWLAAPLLAVASTLRLRPVPPPWCRWSSRGVAAKAGQWAGHCLFVSAFVVVGILLPQLRNDSLVLGALVAVLALVRLGGLAVAVTVALAVEERLPDRPEHLVAAWLVVPWRPTTHGPWVFLTHELVLIPFVLALGCAVAWMMWPLVRHPWHGVVTGITFTLSLLGMNTLLTATNVDSATSSATLIIAGALSIVAGFRVHATAMRLYGLVLVMLMVLKLAVIDMSGQNSITRILSLLVAGVICFALSVAYSRLSARLADASEKPEDSG